LDRIPQRLDERVRAMPSSRVTGMAAGALVGVAAP